MKNYFGKQDIKVNGIIVKIGNDGMITQKNGQNIFCGDCCKKFNLKPSSRNKDDSIKALDRDAVFYISDDKSKIICKSCGRELNVSETFESMQLKLEEEDKKRLENLHIVKVAESWETGLSYYGLSARIPYEDWLKVKKYFHYHTKNMNEDDEFYGNVPNGWVCFDYHKVEEILNIPEERKYDFIQKKRRENDFILSKKRKELKESVEKCKNIFFGAEKPEGSNVVEGELIEDPFSPMNCYGGGYCWVIQDDFIWFIRNNGFDGADWSLNNVITGGAGAIGVRIPFRKDFAEMIRGLVG